MTVKLLVSLNGGLPLSVTRTVMTCVLGPCASVGVQVNTPVAGLRLTPVGAATSEKVSVFVGMSGSVAVLVTVRVASSLIGCVGGTLRVGGLLLAIVLEGEVENSAEPNTISELVVDTWWTSAARTLSPVTKLVMRSPEIVNTSGQVASPVQGEAVVRVV